MPRPREFDEASALKAAMECFWRRGYEATSLRDLTSAMGLTAPSIYNAFGDKQRLFKRALEQYIEHTTGERLRRLQEELRPKEAIRRFFRWHRTILKAARSSQLSLEILRHSSADAFWQGKRIKRSRAISKPARRRGFCSACCLASASWRELNRSVRFSKGSPGPRSRCSTNLIITTKESGDD
jgi:AcrR family transcriptional regulator